MKVLPTILKYLICLIFSLISLLGQAQVKPAQEEEEKITGHLHLIAKPYANGIVLRWGIDNPAAWIALRNTGVQIERIILDQENKPLRPDWEKIGPEKILPWNQDQFKSFLQKDTTNDPLFMVGQALYGETMMYDVKATDVEKMQDANLAFENIFLLANMAADMDSTAANAFGMRYKDNLTINKTYKYAYRISVGQKLPNIFAIDTAFFMLPGSMVDEQYAPQGLRTIGNDGAIQIGLKNDPIHNNYTSYFFERSTDGKKFMPLHKKPMVFNQLDSVNFFLYIDSVENYKTYFYRVRGMDAFGDLSAYSNIVSGMGSNQTKPPQGQLFAAMTGNKVNLTWTQNNLPGRPIAGYMVRRGPSAQVMDDYLTPKLLGPTIHEFEDTPPDLVSGYYYQVIAVDTSGNYEFTNTQYVFAYDSIPPAAPTRLRGVVDTAGVVHVSWDLDKADYIQGYRVFFSHNPTIDFSPATSDYVRDTVFIDTLDRSILNKAIYYRVVAVDGNSNLSEFSEILRLEKPKRVQTPASVIEDYKVGAGQVTFNWVNAPNQDGKETLILRKLSQDSLWTELTRVPMTQLVYTDSTVQESNQYDYAIVIIDQQHGKSEQSYPLSVSIYASSKSNPSQLTQQISDGKSRLNWQAPKGKDVAFYIIYKDLGSGMEKYQNVEANQTTFLDDSVGPGKYGLKAVFTDQRMSDLVLFN